jgi:hypothetical protein
MLRRPLLRSWALPNDVRELFFNRRELPQDIEQPTRRRALQDWPFALLAQNRLVLKQFERPRDSQYLVATLPEQA